MILFKSSFEIQFKCCPLVWRFCCRSAIYKISKLHERALRLVYDDYNSKFQSFLIKDGSFTIHHQNIQTLAIEIFEIHNGFSQIFFLFSYFQIPRINTTLIGKESVQYFGPVIWINMKRQKQKSENGSLMQII